MTLTFIAIVVMTIPFFSHASKFCSKYKCEKQQGDVKVGHFAGNVINNRFLNDTSQKQFNAESESICVRECIKDDPCRTISVVTDTMSTTNFTCYLSESDIYKTDHFYREGSKIILLGTDKCSSSPCPEGSECKPNYETGGYSCSDVRPDIYFSFDKDLEPEYNDNAKKLTAKSKKGSVVKLYDAKTPVLMMADGSDLTFTHSAGYLGNPLTPDRNLTLGMWVKYSGTNDILLYLIASQSIWGLTFKDGLYTLFIKRSGGTEYLKYQMPDIRSYNIWHHIVIRVTKDVIEFSVNGITRDQNKDASSISAIGTAYGTFTLQQAANKGIVGFLDSVSITNDYKSDKFVKEWYEGERKNYA